MKILCDKIRFRWRHHIPKVISKKPFFLKCIFLPLFSSCIFFTCVHKGWALYVLCFLVFLCCLDFGIWSLDHRVKCFFFLFIFFLTFFHSHFFSLLLLSFEPFILLPCLATRYLVLLPCHLGASSCCFELLPHHLVMLLLPQVVASLFYHMLPWASTYYLIIMPHATLSYFATSHYFVTFLFCILHFLATITPHVPSNPPPPPRSPHLLFCHLVTPHLVASLPYVG
jgi:hypothetical protein